MAKKTDAEYHKATAKQSLTASRALRSVGATKLADANRREAGQHNAAARQATKEGR